METLYSMFNLSEIIRFCKNYYAKSPAERLKAQEAGKLEASPFRKMKEETPPDINDTLTRLTESLKQNGLHPEDPTNLPYTLLDAVEVEVEVEDQEDPKEENPREDFNLPTNPIEDEVTEVSEENPEEESMTKAQPREFLGKTPRQKMQTKTDAGIAVKLAIGSKTASKRRKIRKRQTLRMPLQASVTLPKISMGNRSTEMFHGITKIYEESEEELEAPEPEDGEDKVQDWIEYLN